METILPSAMEKTVEGMPFAEAGGSSGELVIAECVELLAAEIDTDSDVVLKVYQNDVQKGVLSMKLQEKFQHPNGMEGTAEAVRTIIREERENVSKEKYKDIYSMDVIHDIHSLLCSEDLSLSWKRG